MIELLTSAACAYLGWATCHGAAERCKAREEPQERPEPKKPARRVTQGAPQPKREPNWGLWTEAKEPIETRIPPELAHREGVKTLISRHCP